MRVRGPLADSYASAAALVIFTLIPYLALTSAINPLSAVLVTHVPLTKQTLQLASGMSNAAYAFGTVLAVQFAVHLRARRMLVLYSTLFVVASVLVAWEPTPGFFIGGHIIQGLTTALMLIAAVPPLITGFGSAKMPITGIVMNMCVFGAVALGPVAGGIQAGTDHWRALFWIVAGLGAIGLLLTLLTFEDDPPEDTSSPWDLLANLLAGGGAAAAFFGASELETHRFLSTITFVPLLFGVAMITALIVHQYKMENPLMPLKQLATTVPVGSILLAMCAGASSVGLVGLAGTAIMTRSSPSHTAMLFWPEFGGAALTALIFGLVFKTRLVAALPFLGMAALAGGAVVLTGLARGPNLLLPLGAGLVGLGVGASVAPALFISAFSVASSQLARVFALVELLRAFAAFIVSPVLMHVAMSVSKVPSSGIAVAMWGCLGLIVVGGLIPLYLFGLGRFRFQPPDLDTWLEGESPAWDSPPLAGSIRGHGSSPVADGGRARAAAFDD